MKLSKEDVLHVATLSRINVDDNDISWYAEQLGEILTEVEKIIDVDIDEEEIMISPCKNFNCYKDDKVGNMLDKEDIMKNAKNTNSGYIVVPKVIND